jgi:ferredoxin
MGDMSRPEVAGLAVDPVACEAVGLCAYLAPDVVQLDRWGYPILPAADLGPEQVKAAHRAVRACPRSALHLRLREGSR